VVQGSADNKVKASAATADAAHFIGVFEFDRDADKADGDPVGIALDGVVKVLLAGNATAGGKAILTTVATNVSAFADVPADAGTYYTCGVFLESGTAGQYIDMLIERGSVTVA
jgi:hypothetical protein